MWLRFVAGRPVSAVTIDFLAWCSAQLRSPRLHGLAVDLGQRVLAPQSCCAALDRSFTWANFLYLIVNKALSVIF